ncbi:DUF433 domain-containing protein [Brevundimonas sp.]|jgi:uncharacterized protein (DUF433 family)|uniref:DUF433 domain-containing protein n=1 Tax=Brevundimonas sp. TaxID=1871086 RepID=UPI002E11DBF2|nr:DUF433 domain-containing protein [Brevundimonas sp.]
MEIAPRITAEAGKLGGKPCIRGLRFPVRDLLGLLAAGMTVEEILGEYPYLEAEDVPAALAYAASQVGHPVVLAAE